VKVEVKARGGRAVSERDIERSECPYSRLGQQIAWVQGTRAFNRGDQSNEGPYEGKNNNVERVWREGWFAAMSRRLAKRGFPGR
jgi:ribosome modulation factor